MATHLALDAIRQISLPSANIERSVEFYRDKLGAKLIAKFDPPGLAFFDCNGGRVLLSGMGGSARWFR